MKQLFQNNPAYKHAYNHGALLAIFIGLFILSACGGGGGAAVVLVDPDATTCESTPFADGCETSEIAKVARTEIVDDCREALKNDETCADSVRPAAVTCLTDPFSEECAAEAVTANPFEGTDFTLNKERETRREACRTTLEASSCRNAIASYCGTVGSASLSTLFDDLCAGAGYVAERQTECRNNINNEACTTTITNFCGAVGAANTGACLMTYVRGRIIRLSVNLSVLIMDWQRMGQLAESVQLSRPLFVMAMMSAIIPMRPFAVII